MAHQIIITQQNRKSKSIQIFARRHNLVMLFVNWSFKTALNLLHHDIQPSTNYLHKMIMKLLSIFFLIGMISICFTISSWVFKMFLLYLNLFWILSLVFFYKVTLVIIYLSRTANISFQCDQTNSTAPANKMIIQIKANSGPNRAESLPGGFPSVALSGRNSRSVGTVRFSGLNR